MTNGTGGMDPESVDGKYFEIRGSLEGFEAGPLTLPEDPSAILRRLGPPPPWTIPSQMRKALEPAYQAAAEAAFRLVGRGR